MHVTGRFSSAWKGAGSDFKGSLRVSSSPIADTGPLLSSHGNNLYNTNICKVGGGGAVMQKSRLLHLDCLCLYVHVDSEFQLHVNVTAKNGRNPYQECNV